MLSKACQYAIKSLIYLAKLQGGAKVPLKEIAEEIGSPPAFTSKILQQLVAADVVVSSKGGHGGFELTDHAYSGLTLGEIIEIMDGNELSKGCFLGLPECSCLNPCPLHDEYTDIKRKLNQRLFAITLDELLKKHKNEVKLKS